MMYDKWRDTYNNSILQIYDINSKSLLRINIFCFCIGIMFVILKSA